jgi:hypothetical protein
VAGELSPCGQPESLVDDMVLGEDIPLCNPLDLAVAEHVHGLITLDSPLCRGNGPIVACPGARPDWSGFNRNMLYHVLMKAVQSGQSWRCAVSAAVIAGPSSPAR